MTSERTSGNPLTVRQSNKGRLAQLSTVCYLDWLLILPDLIRLHWPKEESK